MVRHQGVRLDLKPQALDSLADEPEKALAVGITDEDRGAARTSMHDLVPCSWKVHSRLVSHGDDVPQLSQSDK